MPVVPERKNPRRGSRECMSAQFWEGSQHSSRYIDGVTWELPCEPQALNLNSSSGISRIQQIVAAQSIGLPALPSYDHHSGGVVLDRVVMKLGSRNWWSAIGCRMKAQKMYSESLESSNKFDPLKNLNNYGVCSRSRIQLAPWMTFNNVVEANNLDNFRTRDGFKFNDALSTHSVLKARVRGHDISGTYSTNFDHTECNGDYVTVPCASSLDIASQDRSDGLQYRAGVYQVTAPMVEDPNILGRAPSSMRTVLHAQGAVAVEGEAYIWRGKRAKKRHKRDVKNIVVTPDSGLRDKDGEEEEEESNLVGLEGPEARGGQEPIGINNEVMNSKASQGALVPKINSKDEALDKASIDSFITSLDSDVAVSKEQVVSVQTGPPDEESSKVTDGVVADVVEEPAKMIPVTYESISDLIQQSLNTLQSLRGTLEELTDEVQDGYIVNLASRLGKRKAKRTTPYSFLLAEPQLKISASLGCLARMPLPNKFGHAFGRPDSPVESGGAQLPLGRRMNASTISLTSKGSFSSNLAEAWEPYLRETTLRVFSSIGISAQLGNFIKPVLDYSSASVRLDFGLNSEYSIGNLPTSANTSALDMSSRPDKHRAFASEGKGTWHSCTVSMAQQIIGPLRARADLRFALDPTNLPQNQGERSTLKGLAQTALSIRPSLLETMYGADVVVPGSKGAARVSMWWSPKRREGMMELRLF